MDQNDQHQQQQKQASQAQQYQKRCELKKWNCITLWTWTVQPENCAIDKTELNICCIDCQAGQNSNVASECKQCTGSCGHSYHIHCIERWLKKKSTCPLCDRSWNYQKIGI